MTNDRNDRKVTGKQILCEFVTLAKDVGTYLLSLAKSVGGKISAALGSCDKNKGSNASVSDSPAVSARDNKRAEAGQKTA